MRGPIFHRRFDYRKSMLPNAHLASLEEGVRTIEQAREKTGASIGYPGWMVIYSMVLASLHPQRRHTLVETGTNRGASTIILAQALADSGAEGAVHTFEIDPGVQAIARDNIAAAGHSNRVVFHLGDTREIFAPTLASIDGEISAAFLDGDHEQAVFESEFAVLRPRLGRGALVLVDNTYPIMQPEKGEDARVNGALRTLQQAHGGSLINMRFVSWYTPGLAVWQGELPLEASDWE